MTIKKNLLLGITSIIAITFIISSFSKNSETTLPINKPTSFKENYGIFPVEIPKNIEYAGEKVPIENFDVFESLDREMLINTYWQSQTLIIIKKSKRYFPIIEPILKENGVPDDLKYLAVAESGLSNVTSPSGAKGFWQFLKGTATDHKLEINTEVDERYHLEKATQAACEFLKKSYDKYGSWSMAAASYNMGRRNLSQYANRQKSNNYYDLILGDETGRYVYRLIALKLIMQTPNKFGFYIKPNHKYPKIDYTVIEIDTAVNHWADFAHANDINYKILKELNPWLRENKLTNAKRKTYQIKIAKKGIRNILPNPEFYPEDSLLIE